MFHWSWRKMTNKLMKNKYTPAAHQALPDQTQSVSFYSQVLPTLKSDSFHNSTSNVVRESCTHTKETHIKESCSGKQRNSIIARIFNVVGKQSLAKHHWNLELVNGSILEVIHFPSLTALFKIVSWLNSAVLSFPTS